jgi:hypothetical protein
LSDNLSDKVAVVVLCDTSCGSRSIISAVGEDDRFGVADRIWA